jgi:hypothetical protein
MFDLLNEKTMREQFYVIVVESIGRCPSSLGAILIICDSRPRWNMTKANFFSIMVLFHYTLVIAVVGRARECQD